MKTANWGNSTDEKTGEIQPMKKNKFYIGIGKSQSGDDYGPWLFDHKPNDKELKLFLKHNLGDDFPEKEDGPGIFGSYVYIRIEGPVEIEK